MEDATHYLIQTNFVGLIPFEVLDGGNVDMEDRYDTASSHELINFMPCQCFSWDEGHVVADVYHTMYSSISSSFFY